MKDFRLIWRTKYFVACDYCNYFSKDERGVKMSQNKIGAVLIAGAGIAGIQAALDLAESGYLVHLVEE